METDFTELFPFKTKNCKKCGEVYPENTAFFYKIGVKADGTAKLKSKCWKCVAIEKKEYAKIHGKKIQQQNKANRAARAALRQKEISLLKSKLFL